MTISILIPHFKITSIMSREISDPNGFNCRTSYVKAKGSGEDPREAEYAEYTISNLRTFGS